MTRRAKTILLTSPVWVGGIYLGVAIGFGVGVGLRGAWQDRDHYCRYYEQNGYTRGL